MFRKILFPIDLSTVSQKVMDCIPDLRSAGLQKAIIVHVIDIRVAGGAAASLKEYDQQILDKEKARLEKDGLRIKVKVLIGIPFLEIVGLAQKENVSMIVMGAKGESFVEQVLLGSTTENVVRYARRPVLVQKFAPVRAKSKEECDLAGKNVFKRVLYATDFSDSAEKVIDYLKQMKNAGCEEIVVYHVQDTRMLYHHSKKKLEEFNRIDLNRLQKIKTRLEQFGFKNVKTKLETGVSISKILETSDKLDVSLIAMGAHGRSKVAEMLLGSVSENVVRQSTKPVLLVHAIEAEDPTVGLTEGEVN